ncbi:hypothetical protein ASE09_16585 [Streptomyces sp. Root66D1]|nr:hypothetical protein ASD33_23485 [Streptomyces sp. Root1304]KRA81072.1 hypothetical protein ASE09_16585 [Streptomyces sp. Root66D1]
MGDLATGRTARCCCGASRCFRSRRAGSGTGAARWATGLGRGLLLDIDPRAIDLAVSGNAGGDPEPRTALCLFLGRRMPGAAGLDDRLIHGR